MKPPKKHHYIPVFYLKRWMLKADRICQFSKPYQNTVVPKRVHPSGTGYEIGLYELQGFPPELSQQVEVKFFQRVDSQAAEVLLTFEDLNWKPIFEKSIRSSWSRFLMSLMMRQPEQIKFLRNKWFEDLVNDSDIRSAYENENGALADEDYRRVLRQQNSEIIEKGLFESYMSVMDNAKIGNEINEMTWQVFDLSASKHRLLTSDRPLIRSNDIDDPNGHIVLPIGPTRLFIAAKSAKTLKQISRHNPSALAADVNRYVVSNARKFVFGDTDEQLRFIQNRMGADRQPGVFQ